jgi:hypothetical protein
MVPIVIVCLESNALVGGSLGAQIREGRPRCPIHSFGSDRRLADNKDDLVITPGGPRRRDQVHPVQPGEAVRQNPDGTYTIVPRDAPTSPEPKDEHKKEK